MDIFEDQYYRDTRFLLVLVGQWPYQESKAKQLKRIFFCICLISFAVVQISSLITVGLNIELLVEILPFFMFTVLIGTKYFTCWLQGSLMMHIFEDIKSDWNALAVKDESFVLQKYIKEGWMYGQFYLLCAFSTIFGVIFVLFTPSLLDVVIPLNESRQCELPFNFEYFIDPRVYYYPILLHLQVCLIVGGLAMVAADIAYITILSHGCGLYGILGHRLEHLFDDVHEITSAKKHFLFNYRVANAVKCHWRCLEFIEAIKSCYAVSYVVQLFAIILAITGVLLNLHTNLILSRNMPLVLFFLIDLMGHYVLLFMNILPAQRLTDSSANIFYNVYNGSWYQAPTEIKKFLSFIMQNSMEPSVLFFSTLFHMKFETYSRILQVSFTYFTAICAVRHKAENITEKHLKKNQ